MRLEQDALKEVFENPGQYGCAYAPKGGALDAGIAAPGGWLAGKRLALSLLSGFAEVTFDKIMAGARMVPTFDVYLDRTVAAAQNLPKDPRAPQRGEGSDYSFMLTDTAVAGGEKVMLAAPDSLVGHLYAAARVLPGEVQKLLEAGFTGSEIFWGFSSMPIVLRRRGGGEEEVQKSVRSAASLASVWLRGADEELAGYLKGWRGPGELRLHNVLSGNTFAAGKVDGEALAACLA